MRCLLLLALLPGVAAGQSTLVACGVTAKEYVVGAKLPPSGLFFKPDGGDWRHAGFNLPFVAAVDYDPTSSDTLYMAAGNGLIRVSQRGEKWKRCGENGKKARNHDFIVEFQGLMLTYAHESTRSPAFQMTLASP